MRALSHLPGWHKFARLAPGGDQFPYPIAFEKVVKLNFPDSAMSFYKRFWAPSHLGASLFLFDFCKTIVSDLSPTAAKEIYAAEALSRYVANTLYSIIVSGGFILAALIGSLLRGRGVPLALSFPLVVYSLAVAAILLNLRLLRLREVQIVFTLAFRYRDDIARIVELVPSATGSPPTS